MVVRASKFYRKFCTAIPLCAGSISPDDVYDLFVQICPVILSVTLAETDRARDLMGEVEGISARDAIHAAVMINHEVEWIASFDAGFDGVPGIRRLKLK